MSTDDDRKPHGMSWASWIDQRIEAARSDGAFDDLPGTGKPLPDLDEPYDPDWWAKSLLKREGVTWIPEALQIRVDVERETAALARIRRESEVRARLMELNRRIRAINAMAPLRGPATSLALLDVEDLVRAWRELRG